MLFPKAGGCGRGRFYLCVHLEKVEWTNWSAGKSDSSMRGAGVAHWKFRELEQTNRRNEV
ncbi:MAG: hypothetical protein QXW47_05995 [Candidatus Jordarchaeales archaeon]